ncbi:MAG: NADH-ubiquinone oxidoreductase-F iron-sulfur binding region domain-containing protein [Dehalococcoidia bacterium]
MRVGCDGACHAGPTVTIRTPDGRAHRVERADNAGVRSALSAMRGPAELSQVESPAARRVLRNCGVIDPENLDEALAAGAYLGLERALAMTPEDVVALVRAAGLRGRGGAYFPTATKWEAARAFSGPRSLVVNAEEGEPGVLKDRHLMEGDPHALVEGALIAAYAVGAERIDLYVNGQAALAFARVARAMADARAAGLVGADVLGSGFTCAIELYRGAGGYVCGEESVILNSIEGERAVPRLRPPFPTEAGLWGRPTVINNVETLVNLPLILTEGVDWFRALGTADFPGTKLMSVSGAVARPGLIEAPLGISVGAVLATAGGAQPGHTLTAAVVGGPSGGLLPASLFDLPLVGGMLHPSGPVLGAGGIVALDERTSVAAALRELTAYNRAESCGKCTPCREGTARALDMLDAGAALTAADRRALLDLCDVMQTASLCGLGQMAPGPIRSALTLFP